MSLIARLQSTAQKYPQRKFIVDSQQGLTYRQMHRMALAAGRRLAPLDLNRVYFYAPDSICIVLGLLVSDLIGATSCVLNRKYRPAYLEDVVQQVGDGLLFTDTLRDTSAFSIRRNINELLPGPGSQDNMTDVRNGTAVDVTDGHVVILSSGTTGAPKAALYTWSRLLDQVRHANTTEHRVWLLTYPLNHFAGLQVLLHVLVNGDTLIIPPSLQLEDLISTIREHGVDAISGTPTFWRLFVGRLARLGMPPIKLKQITLGGEPSTADVLERLRRVFPQAAITQIYASTELGSGFAVKDGKPGFPVEFLERGAGNLRLKVVDGELYGLSRNRMIGYVHDGKPADDETDWIATGDLVEIRGDRVLFQGRKSEIINVGGLKVHPARVEAAILSVDGVVAARAYGKPNPVTGNLVAAELEIAPGQNEEHLRSKVREKCRQLLNRYEQPHEIVITEHIARSNGKVVRRSN